MKAKVSRLEISSASYKRKWRSTCEFAESEEAGQNQLVLKHGFTNNL